MTTKPEVIQGVNPELNIPNIISEDEAAAADFVKADSVELLAANVVNWHTNICNQGNHVLNLDNSNPDDPQEILILVYEPEHALANESGFRPLDHNELLPFKHGIRYILDMFEQLPFQYTPSDADGTILPEYASKQDVVITDVDGEQQSD